MHPDPWDAFLEAVLLGQEGEIRRRFEELYRSVRTEMVRFAHWCVRRHNPGLVPGFLLDPEEVVEDAFAELLLRCEGIKKHPKQWLLGVIRQKLDFDVAKARREDKVKREAQQQLNRWSRGRQSRSAFLRAQRLALRRAVNELPDRMKAVVIALCYERESVATTAARFGITENAVIQAKKRAEKRLKALVGGK